MVKKRECPWLGEGTWAGAEVSVKSMRSMWTPTDPSDPRGHRPAEIFLWTTDLRHPLRGVGFGSDPGTGKESGPFRLGL